MKITIFGTGYVGLVTGACLAEAGNEVLCIDVNQERIERLLQGQIPIFEPGLEDLVKSNQKSGKLAFSTSALLGVQHADLIFIAVGTPALPSGAGDLQFIQAVAVAIGTHMDRSKIIVNKSTVPLGTGDKVKNWIQKQLSLSNKSLDFEVTSNPEFLKEGEAVRDFTKPDRIIIGTDSPKVRSIMRVLYAPFNRNHDKLLFMDLRSAELTKYAANAMLATKISFMNELANMAEKLGADIEQVRVGMGSDPRIGYDFIYPGCGYGGSCFPKDVQALIQSAQANHAKTQLLSAVQQVNDAQKQILFEKINTHFQGDLTGKRFAVWGLAFKPKTDDVREAPSIHLIKALVQAGSQVQAYDPKACKNAKVALDGFERAVSIFDHKEACLEKADALVVCTEWAEFRSPDFSLIQRQLKNALIFDGRNVYDPMQLIQKGFVYYGIGRKQSVVLEPNPQVEYSSI